MSIMKPGLFIAISVWILQGCSSLTASGYSSPYTKPEVGTMIRLNQELSVQRGVRIYLQDGYQKDFGDVMKLEPYCQFYVLRSSDEIRKPLTIKPDTFVVYEVFRQKDSVALEGLQVASEGESDFNDGSSQRTMSTYMELSSDTQPNVTRLICSRWDDPAGRFHLSVDEITASLGDIAQFIPPRK